MKFNPGTIVMTRGVYDLIADNEEFAMHAQLSLARHVQGDWGEVCDGDRVTNEEALRDDYRLLSVYKKEGSPTLWIITEWDRSVTTLLFPDEY